MVHRRELQLQKPRVRCVGPCCFVSLLIVLCRSKPVSSFLFPFEHTLQTADNNTRPSESRRALWLRWQSEQSARVHAALLPMDLECVPRTCGGPFIYDVLAQIFLFLPMQPLSDLVSVMHVCRGWRYYAAHLVHWDIYDVRAFSALRDVPFDPDDCRLSAGVPARVERGHAGLSVAVAQRRCYVAGIVRRFRCEDALVAAVHAVRLDVCRVLGNGCHGERAGHGREAWRGLYHRAAVCITADLSRHRGVSLGEPWIRCGGY